MYLDTIHKVIAQQAKGLLTEHEMFQEILEIAMKAINDPKTNEGITR
jgi:hypothetical protein